MNILELIKRIPFHFNKVDYNARWIPKPVNANDNQSIEKLFPIHTKPLFNLPFWLQSSIQNLSILKSCYFYRPNIIPGINQKIAYVRIPKAGSSSIIAHLLGSVVTNTTNHLEEDIERVAYYYKTKRESKPPAGMRYFSVVRNPFTRLVSAYLNTYKSIDSFKYTYDCYFFGLFKQEFTFDEFVDCVSIIPRTLLIDHLKPQKMIIESLPGLEVRVFKLEKEAKLIADFMEVGQQSLKVINRSPRRDFRSFYTLKTLEKVKQIYEQDLHAFGYLDEYQSIKTYLKGL